MCPHIEVLKEFQTKGKTAAVSEKTTGYDNHAGQEVSNRGNLHEFVRKVDLFVASLFERKKKGMIFIL